MVRRGSITLCLAAGLGVACGGNVVVDAQAGAGSTASSSSGLHGAGGDHGINTCVAACATQHPMGERLFAISNGGCICDGCSAACTQAVCGASGLPSDACLPCVQAALAGDECHNHEGLFDTCTKDPNGDCHAFVLCFQACGA